MFLQCVLRGYLARKRVSKMKSKLDDLSFPFIEEAPENITLEKQGTL